MPKKLYKSRDKKMSGVIGGFAEYLDVDPTMLRLIFVLMLLITGVFPLVVFYIIAAIVMEEKPKSSGKRKRK